MCHTHQRTLAPTLAHWTSLVNCAFGHGATWRQKIIAFDSQIKVLIEHLLLLIEHLLFLTFEGFHPSWSLCVTACYSPVLLNCHVENQQ